MSKDLVKGTSCKNCSTVHICSWMNMIEACVEARRKLTKSTSIFNFPSFRYERGVMLIVPGLGDSFRVKIWSISFLVELQIHQSSLWFSIDWDLDLRVQSTKHLFSQKSKSEACIAADILEEAYRNKWKWLYYTKNYLNGYTS